MLTEAPTEVPTMVLWGQWFSEFKTPLGFNFNIDGMQKQGLKVTQMKSSLKFCIILADDGSIYSIGKSNEGALGIKGVTDSKKKGMLVGMPSKVTSVQVGNNHVLALTQDGKVYAWGSNEHG
jgi:alpha-tubulin suppressor-like RCC1 family protein